MTAATILAANAGYLCAIGVWLLFAALWTLSVPPAADALPSDLDAGQSWAAARERSTTA